MPTVPTTTVGRARSPAENRGIFHRRRIPLENAGPIAFGRLKAAGPEGARPAKERGISEDQD